MRTAFLLLLVAALGAGCRSHGRDYKSVNRSSREFLKETMRLARTERRKNLRTTLQFSKRSRENRAEARKSRIFAREAFLGGHLAGTRRMARAVREELTWKDFWSSARFGFLDSGD